MKNPLKSIKDKLFPPKTIPEKIWDFAGSAVNTIGKALDNAAKEILDQINPRESTAFLKIVDHFSREMPYSEAFCKISESWLKIQSNNLV